VFDGQSCTFAFIGIIKGDSNGSFMPKATTTAQQAAEYGTATREAAILMSVRTSDKIGSVPTVSGNSAISSANNTKGTSSGDI
jgi:hypothetical protein